MWVHLFSAQPPCNQEQECVKYQQDQTPTDLGEGLCHDDAKEWIFVSQRDPIVMYIPLVCGKIGIR